MMADEQANKKVVGDSNQYLSDKLFVQKAEQLQFLKSRQLHALKKKNNMIGLLLAGAVIGIYGYTMFAVRQGKMMDAFDKAPE